MVLLILIFSVLFLAAVINLSLFFFYVVFVLSYWCLHTIVNAVEFPSSLTYIVYVISLMHLVLLSICWNSSPVHFKNGPEHFTRGTEHVFIPLMRFLPQSLVSRNFLVRLRYSFKKIFLLFLLVDDVQLHYSPLLVSFLFSKSSASFFIWQFYSFCYLTLSTFLLWHIFQFYFYILVNFWFVSQSPILFSFLHFYVVHVQVLINLFLFWFCKFVASSTLSMNVIEWHHCYYK